MPNILLVANCPSDNTRRLRDAVASGCCQPEFTKTAAQSLVPWDATAVEVLWSDGIIIGTTENFGYMSGAIKDFFERIYYPCLEQTAGKPVALFVKGGLDGQGAKTSVERILLGLKWKLIQPPLVLKGEFHEQFLEQGQTLGMSMAAGLEAGIF